MKPAIALLAFAVFFIAPLAYMTGRLQASAPPTYSKTCYEWAGSGLEHKSPAEFSTLFHACMDERAQIARTRYGADGG